MKSNTRTEDVLNHARILWDYHFMPFEVMGADFVLAMGSHDTRVADFAATLIMKNYAPLLVTSGGFGKVTKDIWKVPEGEKFAEIAKSHGVESSQIIVESAATNSGDNFQNTKALFHELGKEVQTGIIVTKPYMVRRAFATAEKQWPEVQWSVTAPNISFEDYPNPEIPLERMINLMVGDLQRIKVYAEKGFQSPQEIPSNVWESYEYLKNNGFNQFVIPST